MTSKNPQQQHIKPLNSQLKKLTEENESLRRRIASTNSAFLNVVGKSSDGVIILDQEKMVVYANYAAISLFDSNIADLLGEPLKLAEDLDDIIHTNSSTSEIIIPKSDGTTHIPQHRSYYFELT